MSEGVLPPKRDVAMALLRKGSLFLHLDPRVEGVRVPAWLTDQPQLVLQVGFNMVIPVPDLHVDDEGVFGTLSFSRNPFPCVVPWASVFALVGDDGRGLVWPESMPPEIAAEVDREAHRARRTAQAQQQARTRAVDAAPREAGLHSVPPPTAAEAPDPLSVASLVGTASASERHAPVPPKRAASSVPAKRRSLPPYLRVVK